MFTIQHPYVFAFGIIGNIISFMVFLAPLPTFIRVYKKKSTEGFQSFPYVVAIFSAMLWIYYALLKGNAILLITVNVAGVIIETIYVAIYITYAPRQARISTLKVLMFMNFGGFCSIVLLCHYLTKGAARLQVFGWICVTFSIFVFAAPLSVMRTVIRTKSVEYMPINLSVCLTLTATIWFFYGFAQRDLYLTLPNVVGFVFGIAQMTLYFIFKRYENKEAEKQKLPEIASPVKQEIVEIHTINSPPEKSEDVIPPHEQPQEIEVVIANKDFDDNDRKEEVEEQAVVVGHTNNNINNHDKIQQDRFYGLIQGPASCNVEVEKIVSGPGPASCNVEVEKIVSGPGPASAVQLLQCAV